jgi:hypothetical protein
MPFFVPQERLDDAENLISALKSFLFVAQTDGRKSRAVDFVQAEVEEYERKWGTK